MSHESTQWSPSDFMPMPSKVRAAQVLMWIQAALGGCLGVVILGLSSQVADALPQGGSSLLLLLAGYSLVVAIALAVLASKVGSRRRWVRITALVVEGLGIVNAVISFVSEPNFGICIGAALIATIVGLLLTDDASEWFDQ